MSNPENHDVDLAEIDGIYDALDEDDPARALLLAREAQNRAEDADPVLHFLAGIALLELDRSTEAAAELDEAVRLDPDDAEFRSRLALARFRACEFAAADRESSAALEADETLAAAHEARALTVERDGHFEDADRHFARCHELDPEGFSAPSRLSSAEFDQVLRCAAERLPEEFRRHLREVEVTVSDLPSTEILTAEEPALDPELLGLFVGTPLTDRSSFSPGGEMPACILLFKRNLERTFPEREALIDEIVRTLRHELGHYLGMDEEQVREAGLD